MAIKNCMVCGDEFLARSHNAIICSTVQCHNEHHNNQARRRRAKNPKQRTCIVCNKQFLLPRDKPKVNACSDKCRQTRKSTRNKQWVADNPCKVHEKYRRWYIRNNEKALKSARERSHRRYLDYTAALKIHKMMKAGIVPHHDN